MITREDVCARQYWGSIKVRACYADADGYANTIQAMVRPYGNNALLVVDNPPRHCRREFSVSWDLVLDVLNNPDSAPINIGELH